MPNNEAGALRRSQCLVPHGPGAIVDFRVGRAGAPVSVVAAGLEQWDEHSYRKGLANQQVIYEPRLQRKLGVEGFRLPPVARQSQPGVPSKYADRLAGVRFPRWLQCPTCGIVADHRSWFGEAGEPARYCLECERKKKDGVRRPVVPVRFLVTCERGHLDEFPWDRWVQHKDGCARMQDARSRPRALGLTSGARAGLAGLVLKCAECGAERSMEGCFDQGALGGMPCFGRRPWLTGAAQNCTETPRVLQRGASNLYFPVTESALDIPPWSDQIQRRLGRYWSKLVACAPGRRADLVELLSVHVELGMTIEQVVREIEARQRILENPTESTLRWEEHEQLVQNDQPFGAGTELEGRPVEPPAELRRFFERVVVLTRLREVRALRGFTRIHPPQGDRDPRTAAIQAGPHNWLPGIEVRGEGIFVELRRERLLQWEARVSVRARAERIDAAAHQRRLQQGATPRRITPRLLLVHSLAHALMRQLSLDCGYSSASLRERIYVGEDTWDMAGLLIYTASPDSDGTLGGLARQGEAATLARSVEGALAALRWCSSDPLCIEGRVSLSHQLSGAACHACMLASETSCEEFNYMLDRAMLVGTPSDPDVAYFDDILANKEP